METILQKQVEALEKLLQIKEAIAQEQELIIKRQEATISKLEMEKFAGLPWTVPSTQPLYGQSLAVNTCAKDGGLCEYNFPWNSTSPPPCKKCGKTYQASFITSGCGIALNADVNTPLVDVKSLINNLADE